MRSKLVGFTLFILWATAILGAYYVFHKPFDAQNLQGLLESMRSLLAALGLITACAGTGRAIQYWARVHGEDDFPGLALAFGLGFGCLGLLWLGLAVIGLLNVWAAWLALGILLVRFNREWRQWWKEFFKAVRSLVPLTKHQAFIAAVVIFLGAISLFEALSPPHAWDSLMYHLTSPLHHIQAGKLVVEPSLPESGYPQLVEMHYTWLLLLGASRATAIVHWFFGVLTSLLVFKLSRRWINDQAAWLSLAILYSVGTWVTLMGVAYIDLALVFYAMLAFTSLLDWMKDHNLRGAILLGVIAGMGFGVKYTGAVLGLASVIIMIWRRPRSIVRTILYFGLAALVVSLPWLLKNLQTGSLLYPFMGYGEGWDSIRQSWFSRVGSGLLDSNPSRLLTAPILMTILGADGAQTWDASFGPLILMLAPLLLIGWRAYGQQRWFRYGLAWVGLLYIAWLVGAATSSLLIIPRLLFPLVPVLVIMLAGSAQRLFEFELKGLSLGRITLALILVVLALTAFSHLGEFLNGQELEVALGWTSSEEYLYQELGWYHAAVRSLEGLPASSRVLFLFEPRAYYCPIDTCIPDGILDRWYWDRQRGLSNIEIADEWRGQGITHILLYQLGVEMLRSGEDPLSESDWEALDRMIQNDLIEVENFGDAYVLFQLPLADQGTP